MKHASALPGPPARCLWPGVVFDRAVLVAGGLVYALSGLALLLAPAWFFRALGGFPPYNRHYSGDVGAFLLPLRIGLLVAAGHPARRRDLLLVAVGGSMLHMFNHAYDAVVAAGPTRIAADTLPLLLLAVLLSGTWHTAMHTPHLAVESAGEPVRNVGDRS